MYGVMKLIIRPHYIEAPGSKVLALEWIDINVTHEVLVPRSSKGKEVYLLL